MRAKKLLHTLFGKVKGIHQKNLKALFDIVESLLYGRSLTLSDLGRTIQNTTYVKHSIKRVCRFLGNTKLHLKINVFYETLMKNILSVISQPIILVDWSQLGKDDKYYIISAAIPYKGRCLTVYQESHPKGAYNKAFTNVKFLDNLKNIVPSRCTPIIVTDAGTTFRCPWFKKVQALGWDFVGRIRGGEKLLIKTQNKWDTCKEIYGRAKKQAIYLGKGELTKRSKLVCNFILAKMPIKKRTTIKKVCENHESNDRKYARSAEDPWLLATSLDSAEIPPVRIIFIYKKRMCIEQLFRDTKNQRLGFGLKETKTRSVERLNMLLLIGSVATYIAFILGKTAQNHSLQYRFQSNTIKNRSVSSTFNLGCQIFLRKNLKIPIKDFRKTLAAIPLFIIHLGNLA